MKTKYNIPGVSKTVVRPILAVENKAKVPYPRKSPRFEVRLYNAKNSKILRASRYNETKA